VKGVELPEPADTDFGIDAVGEIVARPADTDFGIDAVGEIPPPSPSPLGAGYLILVVRELSGLSQRALVHAIGTSQPTLATLETGNRVPTIRTLLRVADATGFELVVGLRRPNIPAPNPTELHAKGSICSGRSSRTRRTASPTSSCSGSRARWKASDNPQPQPDSRAARFSS
jgi:transcriptional regulator with XRE-family HTH domain